MAVALLIGLAYLQLSTLAVTSPTMDEPNHLVSGYAFLTRGDTRIKLNGPILNNALGALPLLLEPGLELTPAADPAWDTNDYNDIADRFVWNNTASPFRIVYLARLPFIAVGWLLGALIFRWARERSGSGAGLFALALYTFCPNLLAHSRISMTDFVPTACASLTLYAFTRALQPVRRSSWLALVGLGLGLALASKFVLVMLIPAMAVLWLANHGFRAIGQSLTQFVFILSVAALTVWGIYGFQIGPVFAGGVSVPAPGFWGEVESARYYLSQPWPNYLGGEISASGWWYYFPIAFLVKTPLPVQLLLVAAVARTIRRRTWRQAALFLLPSFLILVSLSFSAINLGYRYLLPLLPLIFVYVSSLVPDRPVAISYRPVILLALLVWHISGTLRLYPYYFTFFNELAGGPERGRYILSDSNIDWGQDLVGLKHYVDERQIDRIKLSYFGIAHPTAYGLKTDPLPPIRTALNDQGAHWLHTYYPPDPAPGVYAISVANLMGDIWINRDAYAFFRERVPDTTIGHSIYLYTIPTRGAPINLSLSGLQIEQIDPETYRRFGTNDVRVRWFDAATSLIAPPGEAWLAIADSHPLAPDLAELLTGVEPAARARMSDNDQPYSITAQSRANCRHIWRIRQRESTRCGPECGNFAL